MAQKRNPKWQPPSWIYVRLLFLSTVDFNHHTKVKIPCNRNCNVNRQLTYSNFSKFKMAAVLLDLTWLGFLKTWFLSMGGLALLIFHHGTKFCAKMLIDAQIMAQIRNSKWRPPPSWIYFRLLFLTFHRWSQPSHKIPCQYHNRRLTYSNFSKFKMEAVRHHWVFENLISDDGNALGLCLSIFNCGIKFGAKCWSAPKLWPKNEIRNGGRCHVEFTSGCYFWHTADFPLLVSTAGLNHYTKFRANISIAAADLK